MRLGRVVTAVIVVGLLAVSGCGGAAEPRAQVAGSSKCPHEQALVRRALERSHLRIDVTGDGKLDTAWPHPTLARPSRAEASSASA